MRVLAGVLVALVLVPGALYAFPQIVGEDDAFVVLSGSMVPLFEPGDVIFVDAVPPDSLAVGDVVTFRAAPGSSVLFTHRVVDVLTDGDRVRYRTQGDANEDPDPFVVHPETIVGVYQWHIPYWGLLLQVVRSKVGYVLFVLAPASLVIAREFVRLYHELDRWDRARRARRAEPADAGPEGRAGASGGGPRGGGRAFATFVVALLLAGGLARAPVDASGLDDTSWGSYAHMMDVESGKGKVEAWTTASPCETAAAPPPPAFQRTGRAALPGGGTVRGVRDPGFAYEDVDCDGLYANGLDVPLSNATIATGAHRARGCLVIPPSVSDVRAADVDFASTGGDVTIAVNLTATDGALRLTANGGTLRVWGTTLTAEGDVRVNAHGVAADAAAARLVSHAGGIRVVTSGGPVHAPHLVAHALLDVIVRANGGDVVLDHARLTASDGPVDARANGGALFARNLVADAFEDVTLDADDALHAPRACLRALTGSVDLTTGGSALTVHRIRLDAHGSVRVTARGAAPAELDGAHATSRAGDVLVDAGNAGLKARNVTVESHGDVALAGNGDIDVRNATLAADAGDLTLDATRATHTVFVAGAAFHDADDRAEVRPRNVNVEGEPAHGEVAR